MAKNSTKTNDGNNKSILLKKNVLSTFPSRTYAFCVLNNQCNLV